MVEKEFYLSKTATATWKQANSICKKNSLNLASFDGTQEPEQLLKQYMKIANKHSSAWVSYTDENHEGVWISPRGQLLDSKNLHNGKITNEDEGLFENCLEVQEINGEYQYNDKDCNAKNHFICEKSKSTPFVDQMKEILKEKVAIINNQTVEYNIKKDTLNKQISNLNKINSDLKSKLEECMDDVPTTPCPDHKIEINDLKTSVFNCEEEKTKLKIQNNILNNEVANFKVNNEKFKTKIFDLTKQNKKLDAEILRLVNDNVPISKCTKETPKFNCKYELNEDHYSCSTENFEYVNDSPIIEVAGEHLEHKNESDVTEVTIINSITKYFSNVILKPFPNLKNLNVVNSSLNYLPQGVFNGAGHLEKLYITHNNIQVIGYYVFEGAEKLKVLKLENNNIESLATEAFKGLPSLEVLSLRENKIKELPLHIFVDLKNLRYLVFSFNQLQELDAKLFKNNNEIREIWFDENNLIEIDSAMISYFPQIKRVVFTNNKCIDIDSKDVCRELFKTKIDSSCLPKNLIK